MVFSGDHNTFFFHKMVKTRYAMSLMSTIQVGEQLLTNQVDIKNHVLDLFSSLYVYDNQCKDSDFTTRVTPSQVSDEDNIMLTNLPTL